MPPNLCPPAATCLLPLASAACHATGQESRRLDCDSKAAPGGERDGGVAAELNALAGGGFDDDDDDYDHVSGRC